MSHTRIAALLLGSAGALVLPLAGQTTPIAKPAAAKTWKQPKTRDGQPDLQGVWVNFESTPFERAASTPAAPARAGADPSLRPFADQAPKVPARASLVVDPPSNETTTSRTFRIRGNTTLRGSAASRAAFPPLFSRLPTTTVTRFCKRRARW